jgi:hypothetical protein
VFGPPSGPAVAGFQSIAVALVFFAIGYLIVNAVLGKRRVDPVVRVGLVLPALLGAALVLQLFHIVSGGLLFAHPGAVRAITLLAAIGLAFSARVRRRRFPGSFPLRPALALLAVVTVALFTWGRVVFELLPAGKGDTAFHMGWATSLLNGERLPSGMITGEIPNAYPWLFHSLIAWLSILTPGGRPFHALGPAQLLQVAGGVASLFALGYSLWRKWAAGLSTALLGALTGGFGFLAESPRLVEKVRGEGSEMASTFGDLMLRRSYNLSFHNLAPVYPREVSYALLPALLLLFVLGMRTGRRFYLIAAGFVLGIIGLTGGEAFFAGAAVTAAFVAMAKKLGRIRSAACIGIPAAILYGLWLGPLMFNYFKYGGFVSLASSPVRLTAVQVLGAWGIVTPLAVLGAGVLAARHRSNVGARVVLLYLVVVGALLLVILGTGSLLEEGFETLGRAHRYWPLLFQATAICGGFGLLCLLQGVARLHRVVAIVLFAALAAIALASPWIGTQQLKEELLRTKFSNPALRAALRGDQSSWLSALAPAPGHLCTIAVPREVTVLSHSYTGYRLVWYVWTRVHSNSGRVRWREIYSHIPTDAERRFANQILVSPQGINPRYYQEIIDRFGVDRVLVPKAALGAPALDGYQIEEGHGGAKVFGVVHTGNCT